MKKTIIGFLTLSICFGGDNLPAQLKNIKDALQKKYQIYSLDDLYKLENPSHSSHRTASRDMEDLVGDRMLEEEAMELFVTVGSDQSITDPFSAMWLVEAEGSVTATASDFETDLNYLMIGIFGDDDDIDCDMNCEGEYDDYIRTFGFQTWNDEGRLIRFEYGEEGEFFIDNYEGMKGNGNHDEYSNEHPIVRTHPDTGKKILFVNWTYTKNIVGMDKKESDEILSKIFKHQARLDLTCRFQWTENAVAIWDNRSVQHYAIADFFPGRGLGYERIMDRIAIQGDSPH